jgi:ubiquinone/menaquinone biosynthesis C-methylase UbiE
MNARRRQNGREPQVFSGSGPEMWEHYVVPAVFVPWAQTLLDTIGLQPGDRVLDVACATGTVARIAAERLAGTGLVTGVDLDKTLLEIAQKASPSGGTRIDWKCGDVSSLPFPENSFDVVVCQQGLQFFEDQKSAMSEMYRVLAPGGWFGANVCRLLDRAPGYRALATALGRHVSPQAEGLIRRVFSLSEPAVLRALMESAGFHRVDVRTDVGSAHFRSVEDFPRTYAALWEATPASTEALVRDVARDLKDYCDVNGLTFPIETLIATGRK